MYLNKLMVRDKYKIIRDISFKQGLNLVIDETSSVTQDSGNNVGKTTFLRTIDYCLGGKKDILYKEKEFKRENKIIYDFLHDNEVQFELSVKSKTGIIHTIIRPINGNPCIDNMELTSEGKFQECLFQLIFNSENNKPSFRQLMKKFIRIENDQLTNSLYFLHKATPHTDYEAVFLFLFGFRDTDLLLEKKKLVKKIKEINKKISDSEYTIDDLEQQTHLLKKEIDTLNHQKKNFAFSEEVNDELYSLKKLQSSISELKETIAKLNIKYELSRESINQLRKSKTNIDIKYLEKIYKQAKLDVSNIQTKFNEVLIFHNKMIDNKISYIEGTLDKILSELEQQKRILNQVLDEERILLKIMAKKGALDEYDKINSKLNHKFQLYGNKETLISILSKLRNHIHETESNLDIVNEKILKYKIVFQDNLKSFNEFFAEYSEKLYGNQYYLKLKNNTGKKNENILLDIGNMEENIGTGKKMAQISALDLAYLKYAEVSPYQLPNFVLHDQLETIFENQLETLFELANSIKGQYVVAVLSDKIRKLSTNLINENCILKLSQSDKFFRIP
ncbi:AAA family ATPase [Legionella spiritensis]|uniref:DUF2326 domain-containing protein n=1 Tax=Legionella spiritensis TaxID=452 RepID=A0A0W0Z8A2_LEGSP|nr:AAA family ATPase [Legionella spiritensis]KTD65346.1 hypothetical protein Lspi_0663 [Legionella spiritensis]SNV47376.1 Uncharacterised protein [Legionella spiritensis]